MRNEGIRLGFRLGTKCNHALGEGVFGSSSACIRAMLARSWSSTGSSGAVCPAAICASLRARLAAIDLGTGLSGDMSFIALVYHKAARPQQPKNRHFIKGMCAPAAVLVRTAPFAGVYRRKPERAPLRTLYGDFFVKRFFTRTLMFSQLYALPAARITGPRRGGPVIRATPRPYGPATTTVPVPVRP